MRNLPYQSGKLTVLLANLQEDMGWYGHSELISLNIKKKQTTWLLTVKVKKKGKKWVCFCEADDIDAAIYLFTQFTLQKATTGVKWYPSRY